MSTGLFALLDDITSVLAHVAMTTKVAAKKTAGVLGDDLALNAEQVSGARPERELPVVWAVAKGSALNKVMLVPAALALSEWLPVAITPLMVAGGVFLCYEGVAKLGDKLWRGPQKVEAERERVVAAFEQPATDLVAFERDKIRGAIRTDFILSAEIIVISLGTVADQALGIRALTLALIAIIATVGIYGLVAGIVKLDDMGLALRDKQSRALRLLSKVLVRTAPLLLRTLSVVGVAAVFLVGGGIVTHSVKLVSQWSAQLDGMLLEVEPFGSTLSLLATSALDAFVGLCAGGASFIVVAGGRRLANR